MTTSSSPQQTIGARYPADLVARVETDARRLGLSVSEWMRMAVSETLSAKFPKKTAQGYRKPPTRAELREQARQERTNGNGSG